MNDLAHQLIEANKRTLSPFIDLGNCDLTTLPDELFSLTWLVELNLGAYFWDKVMGKWTKTHNLGPVNQLGSDSLLQLSQLPHLQSLDLSYNQIEYVRFLEKLPRLRNLNLKNNQIEDIRFLENLSQLHTLNLSYNQIEDIRPLESLTQLQNLFLSNNLLKDSSPLKGLTQLQNLFLSSNSILDISSLKELGHLSNLNLRYNQIKEISSLESLSQLQHLNLSNNQIRNFPVELFQAWPLLRTLLLKNNPIGNLPPALFYQEEKNALPNLLAYLNASGKSPATDEAKPAVTNAIPIEKAPMTELTQEVGAKPKTPSPSATIPLNTTEIFFSYAWGDGNEPGESREKVVDELYESLKNEGYQVTRDKMAIGYKGLISAFMKRIGTGQIVIVAVSDKYLKSPYCMFELLEIYRNARFEEEGFRKVIYPIRVESLALHSPTVQCDYLDYWENQEKGWKKLLTKHRDRITPAQFEEYDRVRNINNQLGDLIEHLSDMNTLTRELLSADNFAKIKAAIKEHINTLKS
jgi:Leucine-rich repeat (LRR) protein